MYKKLIVLFLCAALLYPAPISLAAPKGGKVVGGNANISQSGSTTTINQTSNRAIINWNSFDINKNESVHHNMPSSNSAGLHRVVGGGGASQIAGSLQSNGNVYIVNPAGVVIHNGAKINVNGFVATSRDITDQNFMKGNMVFDKPGLPDAAIINKGNITLKDNGLAVLVAPTVRNDGIIAGKLGKVALGGSEAAWKLDMTGDDLITFTLDEKAVNTLHAADGTSLASVENNGQIKAEGGVVVMSAAQLDGFVGSVVNNGEISAASVESKGGKIIFRGEGNKVDLKNNGSLDVSSQSSDGGIVRMSGKAKVANAGHIDATGAKGGKVVLTGSDITLKTGSMIDASGKNGGGTVLVGGNARGKGPEPNAKTVTVEKDAEILASAKLKGDGGQVVVWANEKTQFDGKIEAKGGDQDGDGGFVETSAKLLIIGDPAVVNTSAKKGKSGSWLMDPEDFVIAVTNGDINGETISKNLEENNVVIEVRGDGEGNGDIIINDEIKWSTDNILSFTAKNSVIVNSDIVSNGENAGLTISTETGNLEINDSKLTISGLNASLYINNKKYIIIHDIEELKKVNDDLSANYALGIDIDATSTSTLGNYFTPLATDEIFSGDFNGLGHSINNIYIDIHDKFLVGLFAAASEDSIIENLHLHHPVINATLSEDLSNAGGLIGFTEGKIIKCSIDDLEMYITAHRRATIGGLIGFAAGYIDNQNVMVSQCSSSGIINTYGATTVGGLIGQGGGVVRKSKSDVEINAYGSFGNDAQFGLFVGQTRGDIITDSTASGKINVYASKDDMPSVGGFVGSTSPYDDVYDFYIDNCSVDSQIKIEGSNYAMVGGFVGYNGGIKNSSSNSIILYKGASGQIGGFIGHGRYISSCASKTEIEADGTDLEIGGFAGTALDIDNSYSIGKISSSSGNSRVGGFIGGLGNSSSGLMIEYNDYILNSYTSISLNVDNNNNAKGAFIGYLDLPIGAESIRIENNYWNNDICKLKAIGTLEFQSPEQMNPSFYIYGLSSEKMRLSNSFNHWDFENIWKIDEGKSYPELRGVANNQVISPDSPDPIEPDPVEPAPVEPNPVDPTPTEPDPIQPDPGRPTPSNPDPVTPTDSAPIDPTTPGQPPNPQPSQPTPTQSTPSNPNPSAPSTPSQPSSPAPSQPSPSNPAPSTPQPSNPIPSRPTQSNPPMPNIPQTPPASNTGNTSDSRPTIHYTKDNGNVYVYKDNANNAILSGIPSAPSSVVNKPDSMPDVYEYDPYTATPEERQAFIERIERERAEEKAKYDQELAQAFEDAKRNNFPKIVNRMENTVSNEMDSLSEVVMDLYTLELTIMAAIYSGEKISGSAGKITNFGATAHNSLKTIWGTLMGNGWGDQLRAKKYMQALITKDFMALYMLTIANNARKRYDQVDNTAGKLQLLCQMELATKISESITSDYNDLLYYFTVDAGKDGAKDLINELVIGKVLDDKYLTKVFQGDKTFAETLQPDTFETIKQDVALTKQLSKGIIGETKVVNNFLDHIGSTSRDDSIEGMVNRLMHSSDVNTIITDTMNKYNKLAQEAGLDGSYPDGKMSFKQDIRDCWNWEPELATSLNNVFTADLPGAKIGNAIKAAIGPTLGSVFGIKPKKEQLSNLYSAKTVSAKFSAGDGGEDTAAAANGER